MSNLIIYCTRCREYKGIMKCYLCGLLFCAYCNGMVVEGDTSCDHEDTVMTETLEEAARRYA